MSVQSSCVLKRRSFRHRSSRGIMPIPLAVFGKDPFITDLAQVDHIASLLPGMTKPPIRKSFIHFLTERGRDRKYTRMSK